MDPLLFFAKLGFLTARAKFAAENPELEEKHKFWSDLPEEDKNTLLRPKDEDQ